MECYNGLKLVKRENSLPQVLNLSLPKCFLGSFVNKTQNSSKTSKPFWRLRFGRGSVVRPPFNGEELRDRGFIFDSLWHFITKCNRYYYKIRQLLYYRMQQKFITKYVNFLLQNATLLLQNATVKCDDFITKCDSYYKMRRLLQIAAVHLSCINLLSFFKCKIGQIYL